MSDFTEKDYRPDDEPQRIIVPEHDEIDDEFASVFGDPAEQKHKRVIGGTKKRILTAVAAVAAVGVLVAGTLIIRARIQPKRNKALDRFTASQNLITRSSDGFTAVTVQNQNGTFAFVPKTETTPATESEAEQTNTVWHLTGENADLADSDAISDIISAIAEITVREKVDASADHGLDHPYCTVTVGDKNSGDFTLEISEPVLNECYIRYSGDGQIYKTVAEAVEPLFFRMEDIAKATDIPGMTEIYGEETLAKYLTADKTRFNNFKITVSGKNIKDPLVFVEQKINGQYQFRVQSEADQPINTEQVDGIAEILLSGATADSIYAIKATPEKLAECGLDQPDAVLTVTIGDKSHTLKVAKTAEEETVVLSDDCEMIRVSSALSPYLDLKLKDFYQS